jgi:hypothetical protein
MEWEKVERDVGGGAGERCCFADENRVLERRHGKRTRKKGGPALIATLSNGNTARCPGRLEDRTANVSVLGVCAADFF